MERFVLDVVKVILCLLAVLTLPLIVGWIIVEALWTRFVLGETVHVRD